MPSSHLQNHRDGRRNSPARHSQPILLGWAICQVQPALPHMVQPSFYIRFTFEFNILRYISDTGNKPCDKQAIVIQFLPRRIVRVFLSFVLINRVRYAVRLFSGPKSFEPFNIFHCNPFHLIHLTLYRLKHYSVCPFICNTTLYSGIAVMEYISAAIPSPGLCLSSISGSNITPLSTL